MFLTYLYYSENPGQTPIIIVDFLGLALTVCVPLYHVICGGGHSLTMNYWLMMLKVLKNTGCELVFFDDIVVQEAKIEEWLRRQQKESSTIDKYYNLMDANPEEFNSIFANVHNKLNALSAIQLMRYGAQKDGDFHYPAKNECDIEIVQYAKSHNALAVITCDTDFFIFDIPSKLWFAKEFHLLESRQDPNVRTLSTIEFNRYGLIATLGLSQQHLPLFATLLTNDFTHEYFDQLIDFYKRLGRFENRIESVARYARKIASSPLSDMDIRRLTQHAFGKANAKIQNLIRQSLDFYDIDTAEPSIISDPLEKRLSNSPMYQYYIYHMGKL